MKNKQDYGFTRNDWAHFHDVILDLTYFTTKINLNQEEMESLFSELPEDMKLDAHEWGMSDSDWRDSFREWYQLNKMN